MSRVVEEIENEFGEAIRYRRHTNGRGMIAVGAHVDESAFVDSNTYVEARARIGKRA
ncbi:MAG: pglD, partial [Microbacteriaceae bacterium]|nr:pglD [Microbacteriaceae bacterium]